MAHATRLHGAVGLELHSGVAQMNKQHAALTLSPAALPAHQLALPCSRLMQCLSAGGAEAALQTYQ